MSTYFIANLDIHDREAFGEYPRLVAPQIEAYGGRYLVRGGDFEILEGGWSPKRLVVLEFPSVEQARRWYDSDDYRELRELRQRAAATDLVLVEGV